MIKVNIIGSAIADSAVKALPKAFYEKDKHYLSINPYSFVKKNKNAELELEKVNSESYKADINKTIFSELKKNKGNCIVIDLLDCRLPVTEFLYNGKNYIATENNGLKTVFKNGKREIIKEISAFSVSLKEWTEVFDSYASALRKLYDSDKIIVLEAKSAFQYITANNEMFNLAGNADAMKLMLFYERLYTIFKTVAPDFKYIPFPDVWYCEGKESRAFSFYLSDLYYTYASDAIMATLEKRYDAIELLHKTCTQKLLSRFQSSDPREKRWKDVTLKDFCGTYKDDFGNVIETGNTKINVTLKGGNNVLKLGEKCSVSSLNVTLISNNNIIFESGCVIESVNVNCRNVNNISINENTQLIRLNLTTGNDNNLCFGKNNLITENAKIWFGNSVKFIVENNNKIGGMEFTFFNNSSFLMGNGNVMFSARAEIRGHSFTETVIGNDTLWSQEINLINGDGHSIFDIESKNKINDMKTVPENKRKIIIGNHVWIGKRAMILNGTQVKDGSVIGALSLVKKAFPNNCIIAGNPAKVIRKNIAWTRDNDTTDITACGEYVLLTDESK